MEARGQVHSQGTSCEAKVGKRWAAHNQMHRVIAGKGQTGTYSDFEYAAASGTMICPTAVSSIERRHLTIRGPIGQV
jgi:hypothetical protein